MVPLESYRSGQFPYTNDEAFCSRSPACLLAASPQPPQPARPQPHLSEIDHLNASNHSLLSHHPPAPTLPNPQDLLIIPARMTIKNRKGLGCFVERGSVCPGSLGPQCFGGKHRLMRQPARHVRSLERRTESRPLSGRRSSATLAIGLCAAIFATGTGCALLGDANRTLKSNRAPAGTTDETVVRSQDPADIPGAMAPPATSLPQPRAPIPNPASVPPAITDLVPAPPNFSPDSSGPDPIVQPTTYGDQGDLSPWGLSSIAKSPGQPRVRPAAVGWRSPHKLAAAARPELLAGHRAV